MMRLLEDVGVEVEDENEGENELKKEEEEVKEKEVRRNDVFFLRGRTRKKRAKVR